MNMFQILINLS